MTHDELLAKISRIVSLAEEACKIEATPAWFETTAMLKALRAVVELHKPFETTPPWEYVKYLACSTCENYTNDGAYFLEYPCPTIQAIEKELG